MKKTKRLFTLYDGINISVEGPIDPYPDMEPDILNGMIFEHNIGFTTFRNPFYCAIVMRPALIWDSVVHQPDEKRSVFCETRKGLMRLVRLEVAELRNPGLRKIINKLEGSDKDTIIGWDIRTLYDSNGNAHIEDHVVDTLRVTRPPYSPKKGDLYFDKIEDVFKVFDGKRWNIL